MGEVDEDVDAVPMPDPVKVGVRASLQQPILVVATSHVVADQELGVGRLLEGALRVPWRVLGHWVAGFGRPCEQLLDGVQGMACWLICIT